jgi:uncharacterized protein YkwD
MNKHLLTVLTLLITLTFAAQPVSAAVAPTAPQMPKRYFDLWQQITLRDILLRQQTTPTPTPTTKPVTTTSSAATPTPTKKPTPTPTKTPTTAPTTSAPSTNDVTNYIMNEINSYRKSLGLSTVQTSTETCNFAKIRAQEISTSFTHDGFTNRKNAGTLPYASWTSITENIAMTSDYKQVETMWQNSAGHAANMRANTPYVCVMQYGNYFAYEGMKP